MEALEGVDVDPVLPTPGNGRTIQDGWEKLRWVDRRRLVAMTCGKMPNSQADADKIVADWLAGKEEDE